MMSCPALRRLRVAKTSSTTSSIVDAFLTEHDLVILYLDLVMSVSGCLIYPRCNDRRRRRAGARELLAAREVEGGLDATIAAQLESNACDESGA